MTASPNRRLERAIEEVITSTMDRVIKKVLETDPFVNETNCSRWPLYAALVPDEIFKGSHFERVLVGHFGQAWQELAVVAAREGLGYAETGRKITGAVPEGRLQRIQEVLNRIECKIHTKQKRIQPNWKAELEYIMKGKGNLIPTSVICDVYVIDSRTRRKRTIEIVAPIPNSNQSQADHTRLSKENVLKLHAMQPRKVDDSYVALLHFPYDGQRCDDWKCPMHWFNMNDDPCVLDGNEFWDLLGGSGTYALLVNVIHRLGEKYRHRIYCDYLGISPPIREEMS